MCFLTGAEPSNRNFELAARNLSNIRVQKAAKFSVPDLLRNDYIFITRQGLIELEEQIERRNANYFRNRKVASESAIVRAQGKRMDPYEKEIIRKIVDAEEIAGFDDKKKLAVHSETLKSYVYDLRQLQRDERIAASKSNEQSSSAAGSQGQDNAGSPGAQ